MTERYARTQPEAPEPLGADSATVPHQLLAQVGYTITHRLGASDRGEIFAAADSMGQVVAVRVLPPGRLSARSGEAFQREARAGVRLHHPHIVRSIATGEREGYRYLVMELIDGTSLAERVRTQGPLSEREAVILLSQLAQALGYAARHGVAHRRLAPSDVLLGPARLGVLEPFCAKLSCCGLSHLGLGGEGDVVEDDRRALASTICWSLTPPASAATKPRPHRRDSAASTMRMPGVSAQTMQLLGRMFSLPSVAWEEVVERARHLPGLPAAPRL